MGSNDSSFLIRGVILSELDFGKINFSAVWKMRDSGQRGQFRGYCNGPGKIQYCSEEAQQKMERRGWIWAWLESQQWQNVFLEFDIFTFNIEKHSNIGWTLNGGLHTQWVYFYMN